MRWHLCATLARILEYASIQEHLSCSLYSYIQDKPSVTTLGPYP
jgi:hypothetical protein